MNFVRHRVRGESFKHSYFVNKLLIKLNNNNNDDEEENEFHKKSVEQAKKEPSTYFRGRKKDGKFITLNKSIIYCCGLSCVLSLLIKY